MSETVAAGMESGTPPRKNATIYDIADAAGVSHQSVSRYMRGMDMRPGTKAKIDKALETLSYRPNLTARALITGRSHRIGALTHEINQFGPSLIIQGATAAAREAGYLLDVVSLDMGDIGELNEAVGQLLQYDIAGILAFASTDSAQSVFERTDFGVPVLIASEPEDLDAAAHLDGPGIGAIVAHLVSLGHERLLHIAGPETWSAARNRLRAFEAALDHHGLKPAGILHGDWSARSGYETIAGLEAASMPTAIVAANDQMALGAIHALVEAGYRVPGDVSVTGVDDTPEAPYFTPSLTTLRLDFRAQGRDAVLSLLNEIEPSERLDPPRPEPQLIVRDSTGVRTRPRD